LTKTEKELWNSYKDFQAQDIQAIRQANREFAKRYPGQKPTKETLRECGYDEDAALIQKEQNKQKLLNAGFTIRDSHWFAADGTDLSKKGRFTYGELVNDIPKRVDGRAEILEEERQESLNRFKQARERTMRDIQDFIDNYFVESEKTKVIPQIQKAKKDLNDEKEKCLNANIKEFSLTANESEQLRQEINSTFDYEVESAWSTSFDKKPRETVANPELYIDDSEAYDIREKYSQNLKAAKERIVKTTEALLDRFEEAREVPNEETFYNYVKTQAEQVSNKTEFFPLETTDKERNFLKEEIYNDVISELLNKYRALAEGQCRVVDKSPSEIIGDANKNKKGDNSLGKAGTTKPKVTTQTVSGFAKTNVSFSGCDMVITAEMVTTKGVSVSVMVGEAQTVSYSIYRKLSPILNIGNINAKDYVGGPRTIAGSLVMTVFNQHWGTQLIDKFSKSEGYASSRKVLMDELAPMNITISMANEYGICSRLAIYGVRIFSEGQVMSINDIFTENTFQYVALNIDYLADVNTKEDLAPLYRNIPAVRREMTEAASKTGIDEKNANGNTPPNEGGGNSVKKGDNIDFDPDNKPEEREKRIPQSTNTGFAGLNGEMISYDSCGNNRQGALRKAASMKQEYTKALREKIVAEEGSDVSQKINKELDKIKQWYMNSVREVIDHYENIDPMDIRTDRTGV